jgi:hypothetical protein
MALTSKERLTRNLDLFIKMKDLAEQQAEFVEMDEMDRFLDLSSKRSHLQREIAKNDRAPGKSMAEKFSQGTDRNAMDITREVAEVIQSIQETDRKIERFIQEKKENLLSDIRGMRHGQRAMKGYGGKKTLRSPKFIDQKG